MAFEFRLPDIGEGIHEGEIVKWFVKAGDTIEEDDVLAEVQNDKSVVEIPSPVSGTVEEVLVDEGTVAVVGDVIVKLMLLMLKKCNLKVAIVMTLLNKKRNKKKHQLKKNQLHHHNLRKLQQLLLKKQKLMRIKQLRLCLLYVNTLVRMV